MGYAGYDDYGYGGGGYYALPLPGGDLDARTYLDGPGTHAYLQQGRYSSYAYEGQNGSIFEQNTTTSSGGYEQSTYYLFTSESYRYSHSADFSYSNPPLYLTTGGFGYTTQQQQGTTALTGRHMAQVELVHIMSSTSRYTRTAHTVRVAFRMRPRSTLKAGTIVMATRHILAPI